MYKNDFNIKRVDDYLEVKSNDADQIKLIIKLKNIKQINDSDRTDLWMVVISIIWTNFYNFLMTHRWKVDDNYFQNSTTKTCVHKF